MRRATSSFLVICLAALASSLDASEALKTDFDQNIDVPQIFRGVRIKAASDLAAEKDLAHASIAGILPVVKRHALPPEIKGLKRPASVPLYFYGPWRPKIEKMPEYKDALQYPPLVRQLPSESRDPLEREWEGIENNRTSMLSEADQLEPQDIQLAADADWIVKEDKYLDDEFAAIEQDRAIYRARCGVARPPSDCEAIRGRLNTRVGRYNERVAVYNTKLEDWKRRRPEIETKGKKIDSAIATLGPNINAYSRKAEQALEQGGLTRVRIQAQTGTTVFASAAMTKLGRVTLYEGYQLLGQVFDQLSRPERDNRSNAFPGAQSYMQGCAALGGCVAPTEHPVYNDPREKPYGPRIDISIFKGTAFVNDPVTK